MTENLIRLFSRNWKKKQKEKPNIFICAIRSYGGTAEYVKEIANQESLIVFEKLGVSGINNPNEEFFKEYQAELNCM